MWHIFSTACSDMPIQTESFPFPRKCVSKMKEKKNTLKVRTKLGSPWMSVEFQPRDPSFDI
jgi:hypothetical protein